MAGHSRVELRSLTLMKLNKIVRLQALNRSVQEIATTLECSDDEIRDLIKHPSYARLRDRYMEKMYKPTDEYLRSATANTILMEAAPDAAVTLDAMLDSDDDVTRRLAAQAILDRTGHGPIHRKVEHRKVGFDPVTADLFLRVVKEAGLGGKREDPSIPDATVVESLGPARAVELPAKADEGSEAEPDRLHSGGDGV